MPIGVLVPDVDNRVSAWVKIVARKKKEESVKKNKSGITITISRQFGCEGYPLAKILQKELEEKTGQDWIILDKDLIDKVAKDTNLSKTLIKDLGMVSTFISDFFSSFTSGAVSKDQVFKEIAEIILRVAKEGNAIIVGRGAAVITQHLENCHHFRLEAPLEYRIDSIAKRANIEQGQAEKIVKENQAKREKFLKEFLQLDVHKNEYYDAIFNNSKNSIETIAKGIISLI